MNGAESLARNENCTYNTFLGDIPLSNCSNNAGTILQGYLPALFPPGSIQGTCQDGECVCLEGFSGHSDWINLEGLDCHMPFFFIRFYASCAFVGWGYLYVNCARVLHKTYKTSRPKDKTFKSQLSKAPAQVAIYFMTCQLPLVIFSITKFISPSTIIIDPAVNPFFFMYTILSLNAEWWAFSIIFRSIVDSILNTVHRHSDRAANIFIAKAKRIAKSVPIFDMITRVFLIIVPAIIGAVIGSEGVGIWVFFFNTCYSFMKVVVFLPAYLWGVFLAIRTLEEPKDGGSLKTGSTMGGKLRDFKNKMKSILVAGTLFWLLLLLLSNYLLLGGTAAMYGQFTNMFIVTRGGFAGGQALTLEMLYLDLFPFLLKLFRRKKSEGGLNTITGSFGRKFTNDSE